MRQRAAAPENMAHWAFYHALDEPFGALDALTRQRTSELVIEGLAGIRSGQ